MRTGIKSHGHNLRLRCEKCKEDDAVKKKKLAEANDPEKESESVDNDSDSEKEPEETEEKEVDDGVEDNLRKRQGEASSHCHFPLFEVTDGMKNYMQGGQPYRRCKEAERIAREEKEAKQKIKEEIRKTNRIKEKDDLKSEVIKLRNKLRKEARVKTLVPKVCK